MEVSFSLIYLSWFNSYAWFEIFKLPFSYKLTISLCLLFIGNLKQSPIKTQQAVKSQITLSKSTLLSEPYKTNIKIKY